jgi:crotonobetainyl-CoA:carnitine CoA-transferase CaiB-like acyl-CoA transferase
LIFIVAGNTVTYNSIKNGANAAPPVLGEHTAEVLQAELGISSDKMQSLIDSGVIGCHE